MRFLAGIGALAIAVAILAAGYFLGGYYSVAASDEDPGIVAWALDATRKASVEKHAGEPPPFALDDPAVVRAGAQAFATRGCVTCHGAPGVGWVKFSEGMRPYPPDLKEIVPQRQPAQLFWVVKNGIKMTGMPGFSLIGVDDREIWSIVAFARRLPTLSEEEYKTLSASGG